MESGSMTGWYVDPVRRDVWWWWDGRAWTGRAEWDGARWALCAVPAPVQREPLALSQPWVMIVVVGGVLTVLGTVAGVASWNTGSIDDTGCQTDTSITATSVALWVAGLVTVAGATWLGRRWSARHGVTRFPLEALLALPALVLPWLVYVSGFNQCWN